MSDLQDKIARLVDEGRHREAATLALEVGDPLRAAELFAAVWAWEDAIAAAEGALRYDLAYRYALDGQQRGAFERILEHLSAQPAQTAAAAAHAVMKGRVYDAARMQEAVGEIREAASLYERANEYAAAATCHLSLGDTRKAGMLYERHLREHPEDGTAALALGRVLAQFGRWEHAVRALQKAADDEGTRVAALKLLVGCFAALGLEESAASCLHSLRIDVPEVAATVHAFLIENYGDERGLLTLVGGDTARDDLLAGRYAVLKPLGAGASGRVVLASDAFHDRQVAIKILTPTGGAGGRDAMLRFSREAKVAAGMSHPNIVRVHEFNADGPFLVMEWMAGGTLEDRLFDSEKRPVRYPLVETHHVVKAVLCALEAVHRRGVVHRDLKPPNIFFTTSGEVKIGDFGVAHLTDLGATLTGAMMGTLAYMAPEQITASRKPTAATDFYALGVILFRALTGRLPYPGPDFLTQHLEAPVPLVSETLPALGMGFDKVIQQLLAKDPEMRPDSASDVLGIVNGLPWGLEVDAALHVRDSVRTNRAPAEVSRVAEADRYEAINASDSGVVQARDRLLERDVSLHDVGSEWQSRIWAWAAADGPFIQAVYGYDAERGTLILEEPSGVAWDTSLPLARRLEALDDVRAALDRLHTSGVCHGSVDAAHIRVGTSRAVLLFSMTAETDRQKDLDALQWMRENIR